MEPTCLTVLASLGIKNINQTQQDDEDSVFAANKPVALTAELATEYQFYKIIHGHSNGITQTELSNIFNHERSCGLIILLNFNFELLTYNGSVQKGKCCHSERTVETLWSTYPRILYSS